LFFFLPRTARAAFQHLVSRRDRLTGFSTRVTLGEIGELKRDPVCGTYVSTATSVKRTIGGEVVHFCSVECSNKYGKG